MGRSGHLRTQAPKDGRQNKFLLQTTRIDQRNTDTWKKSNVLNIVLNSNSPERTDHNTDTERRQNRTLKHAVDYRLLRRRTSNRA